MKTPVDTRVHFPLLPGTRGQWGPGQGAEVTSIIWCRNIHGSYEMLQTPKHMSTGRCLQRSHLEPTLRHPPWRVPRTLPQLETTFVVVVMVMVVAVVVLVVLQHTLSGRWLGSPH